MSKRKEPSVEKYHWGLVMPQTMRDSFAEAGALARFAGRFFKEAIKPPYEVSETLRQCFQLGYKSLGLVGLSGFIIGLVLTMQLRPTMIQFGAEALIPNTVAIAIIREIGPVLTALICAGKVGSGIGAELGSMKVTEQLDAMSVSGAKAFNYTVVTRVIATTIMIPLLVVYTDAIAIFGSYVGVNISGNLNFNLFINHAMSLVFFIDVIPATIKSFFFGFTIGIVGCYKGFNASKGTVGVGKAANSAVVVSSLLIFIIDMIAVQITQFFI